jgi:tRNA1(Val) A37 N6-methylase TrmN6
MTADEITHDTLAGDWRIFQLRRGHRFSTDDLLTAWTAARAKPEACRLLDLGAGIGSVGFLTLWRLPPTAHLTMVEVQAVSHALACRTLHNNGLSARVTAHLQDLRHWPGGEFDLITASPPYFPLGRGVHPRHAQKLASRFELHGDVFDYCAAAANAPSRRRWSSGTNRATGRRSIWPFARRWEPRPRFSGGQETTHDGTFAGLLHVPMSPKRSVRGPCPRTD